MYIYELSGTAVQLGMSICAVAIKKMKYNNNSDKTLLQLKV